MIFVHTTCFYHKKQFHSRLIDHGKSGDSEISQGYAMDIVSPETGLTPAAAKVKYAYKFNYYGGREGPIRLPVLCLSKLDNFQSCNFPNSIISKVVFFQTQSFPKLYITYRIVNAAALHLHRKLNTYRSFVTGLDHTLRCAGWSPARTSHGSDGMGVVNETRGWSGYCMTMRKNINFKL